MDGGPPAPDPGNEKVGKPFGNSCPTNGLNNSARANSTPTWSNLAKWPTTRKQLIKSSLIEGLRFCHSSRIMSGPNQTLMGSSPQPSYSTSSWGNPFVKQPREYASQGCLEVLPENVSRIGRANQGASNVEFFSELAIASVAKGNYVPLPVRGVNQLHMSSVFRHIRATDFVAEVRLYASGILPVAEPIAFSASFSQITYSISHNYKIMLDYCSLTVQFRFSNCRAK